MIGKTILHYKIIEKLGEGGMGIVYLAEDSKLKRQVAIKFLPRHIAANSDERKRFEIEAQAAAALNHPNIATIHNIEEAGEEYFLVMEYIPGKDLKDYLKEKQLSTEEALDIAIQVAQGLQEAHNKGVIHRDIKSTNIMSNEKGRVKIMDFGLAKIRGSAQLTMQGTTVGTAAYMSPEQARGEEVDQRADIWSLGVLFYELLTGHLPFRGDYEQAVIYCIINEDFTDLKNYQQDIPSSIVDIIKKALQKTPENRYQYSQQLLEDLLSVKKQYASDSQNASHSSSLNTSQNVSAAAKMSLQNKLIFAMLSAVLIIVLAYLFYPGSSEINTLAVLPFINISDDQDSDYITEGISANLINRLSELPGLKVMSRHSVKRFSDQKRNPIEAGQLLEVQAVLTGQLNIRQENLIIDVELLDTEDGRQLWGERIERGRTDILTIESDIVTRISDKLKGRISGDIAGKTKDISYNPLAYDLYLRGRYIMIGTSDDGPARAQEYFRQAIEKEPRMAEAYAGLGQSYVNQAWLNSRNRDEVVPLAKAALKKAIELDVNLSEAYVLAGEMALFFDWDWSAAEENYRKAIELNPGSDIAHREYAGFLLGTGFIDQSIAEARIAQSLDPLSVYATHQLGYCFLASEQFAQAAAEFRKALDLNPTWIWGNIKLGMSLALMGDKKNAMVALARADALLVGGKLPSPLAQSWIAQIAYLSGDTVRIHDTLKRLQYQEERTYTEPYAIADIFFRLGDYDRMFEYLEKGFEVKSPVMASLLLDGLFDKKKIKNDPRFQSLLKRMNFPN